MGTDAVQRPIFNGGSAGRDKWDIKPSMRSGASTWTHDVLQTISDRNHFGTVQSQGRNHKHRHGLEAPCQCHLRGGRCSSSAGSGMLLVRMNGIFFFWLDQGGLNELVVKFDATQNQDIQGGA